MANVGILAFGSLRVDPGTEISPLIVDRIPTMTPFPVEFGRISATRGGAPTVAPHRKGGSVEAEILVLQNEVTLAVAKDLLWRRETQREGSDLRYRRSSSQNAVLVRDKPGFGRMKHVLYTDFNAKGKMRVISPQALARAAIDSVARAPTDKDGISYLVGLVTAGVATPLTEEYAAETLACTDTSTLPDALEAVRRRTKGAGPRGES